MKRLTFLLAVLFLLFGSNFSLFAQTQNEQEEEIIEVEMNCFDFDDIEIIIEDILNDSIETDENQQLICVVEQDASFEGGMEHFYNIVNNQMRFSETMIEGRVFIQFVVEKTGKVTDAKVVKGLSEENDKEALRIMSLINEKYSWTPATEYDKKIRVKTMIYIHFERKDKSNVKRVYKR